MDVPPATAERDDWTLTFAFWLTLLVAGALFATVSLAPKLQTISEQQIEFAANQQRIAELDRQATELERVAAALEHDPAFADELARVEFDAGRPGEERISVDRTLRLGGGKASENESPAATNPPAGRWPIPGPILESLATQTRLRSTLLLIAAMLTLGAFLLLHEEQATTVQLLVDGFRRLAQCVSERYHRT